MAFIWKVYTLCKVGFVGYTTLPEIVNSDNKVEDPEGIEISNDVSSIIVKVNPPSDKSLFCGVISLDAVGGGQPPGHSGKVSVVRVYV